MLQLQNLKEIKFHKDGDGIVSKLQLCDLPSLKRVDLSSIHAFASLYVFLDNAEDVIYPNFEKIYRNGKLVDFHQVELQYLVFQKMFIT